MRKTLLILILLGFFTSACAGGSYAVYSCNNGAITATIYSTETIPNKVIDISHSEDITGVCEDGVLTDAEKTDLGLPLNTAPDGNTHFTQFAQFLITLAFIFGLWLVVTYLTA